MELLITTLQQYLQSSDFISALLASSIGVYAGHEFSIGRDKRKEFNEAATSLRLSAKSVLQSSKRVDMLFDNLQEEIDVSDYMSFMCRYDYRLLVFLYKRHVKNNRKVSEYGDITFTGNKRYLMSLAWLIHGYIKRR